MTLLNAEKFRSSLWSDAFLTVEEDEWIEKNYQDSDLFWTSLLSLQQTLSPIPIQTELHRHYDFYHDAVLRHLESNHAFVLIEEGGFTSSWNYKKLHRLVNFQVKQWTKYSLQPGQIIVITTPIGPQFWLALLTAFRLGLTICYLPPDPSLLPFPLINSLIDEIKPDLVVSDSQRSYGHQCPHHLMNELLEDEQNYPPHSHAYMPSQVMQLSLALHRTDPYILVPLDAETCYLHALRDGLLTLNLKPGTCWAIPLASAIQSEPFSTLASLLSGATTVHVKDEVLQKDPFLLKEEKIHHLGISLKLQNLWKQPSSCPKSLKAIFTSPLMVQPHQWKSFIQRQNLEKVPSFQVLIDNSLGGVVLFSRPNLNDFNFYLKPSLGTPWSLKTLNKTKDDAFTGFGHFYLGLSVKENTERSVNLFLSHIDKDCLISSFDKPHHEGITLPIEKIEKAISQLPFVEACMLHPVQKIGSIFSTHLILLVFVDPLKNDLLTKMKLDWTQEINRQISNELGSHFIPHTIEFYSLTPKKTDSSIDRTWCTEQYDRGLLSMKRHTQHYLFMSIVRKLIKNF